jgi:hypothetical protein
MCHVNMNAKRIRRNLTNLLGSIVLRGNAWKSMPLERWSADYARDATRNLRKNGTRKTYECRARLRFSASNEYAKNRRFRSRPRRRPIFADETNRARCRLCQAVPSRSPVTAEIKSRSGTGTRIPDLRSAAVNAADRKISGATSRGPLVAGIS